MNDTMERRPDSVESLLEKGAPTDQTGQEFIQNEKQADQTLADRLVRARFEAESLTAPEMKEKLEAEIEDLETAMAGKNGTQEWDDLALMVNDKERQLEAVDRVAEDWAQEDAARVMAESRASAGHGLSGETTLAPRAAAQPEPKLELAPSMEPQPETQASAGGWFARATRGIKSFFAPIQQNWQREQAASRVREKHEAQQAAKLADPEHRAQASAAYEQRAMSQSRGKEIKPTTVEVIDEDEEEETQAAK